MPVPFKLDTSIDNYDECWITEKEEPYYEIDNTVYNIKDGIHIEPKSNKVEEWENIMGTLFQELESGNPRSWELTENIFDTQNYF